MPNLLHDAQQTRYGQLVTNFTHHHQQQIYISSDFTKKKELLWCEKHFLLRNYSIDYLQRVLLFSKMTIRLLKI